MPTHSNMASFPSVDSRKERVIIISGGVVSWGSGCGCGDVGGIGGVGGVGMGVGGIG